MRVSVWVWVGPLLAVLDFRHQGMARGDQGSFLPKFEKEETRFLAASGDVFCLGPCLPAWRLVCAVLPASDYGGNHHPMRVAHT